MEPQTLDQDALNLTKAIRQHESGGNFESQGKSGEYGAYQFTAPTWKGYAKEVLGDENAPMTKENQNKIAYTKIKKWKDEGKNVGQIASMWNAGEGRPNAYKENYVGTNEYGVHYDTPTYAKKVAEYYQHYKAEKPAMKPSVPSTTTQPKKPEDPSLGSELLGRITETGKDLSQAGTGIADIARGDFLKGGKNIFSGLLQSAGNIAGGIGDITGKALELIPGVKEVQGLIGEGVGKLAETETGQKVVGAISKFQEEHPDLSGNIGAITNIVSAIPILKGIGMAKNIALDAASMALKNQAEKIALRDLTEIVSKTIGGRTGLTRNPEAIKTIIAERALPEIVDGKYLVSEARSKLASQIKHIDDNIYQPALDKAVSAGGVQTSFVPMQQVENKALEIAKSELKDSTPIKAYFKRLRDKYGEFPPINELNKAKRIVSKNISEAGFNSPTYSTDKIVRSALQESVEEGGKAIGIPNIDQINQEMGKLIKAQDMLKYIDGKSVKTGLVGETIKNAATVGGEMAGSATGIPIAGTLAGRQAGGFVGKKITGVTKGILDRTSKDAQRVTREELKKKMGGLFAGTAVQKATNQKKDTPRK